MCHGKQHLCGTEFFFPVYFIIIYFWTYHAYVRHAVQMYYGHRHDRKMFAGESWRVFCCCFLSSKGIALALWHLLPCGARLQRTQKHCEFCISLTTPNFLALFKIKNVISSNMLKSDVIWPKWCHQVEGVIGQDLKTLDLIVKIRISEIQESKAMPGHWV